MEETNQVEPESEAPKFSRGHVELIPYRDPQIDELIDELRVLHGIAHFLDEIREALYTNEYSVPERVPPAPNEFPTMVFPPQISQLAALTKAIEKLRPVPWYVRLANLFRVRRVNREFQKAAEHQKQQEELRRVHMQHLAENAGKLNYGRFRSRY
jgi:hypothetical protein